MAEAAPRPRAWPVSRSISPSSVRARTSPGWHAGSTSCGCATSRSFLACRTRRCPALLAAADICLVPLRDVPLFSTFIPSKMFEYLAAGKAVIGAVTGEAAQILREAGRLRRAARRTAPPSPTRSARSRPIRRGARRWDGRDGPTSSSTSTGSRSPRQYRKILDCAWRPAMRLLVTGGSGFLGGYVLREAARRGHETVALARSLAAARTVADRGAQPVPGDLDDAGAARRGVRRGAMRRAAQPRLAGLRTRTGDRRRGRGGRYLRRAVFVSTTAVTTTLAPPTKSVRLTAEQRIRSIRAASGRSCGRR